VRSIKFVLLQETVQLYELGSISPLEFIFRVVRLVERSDEIKVIDC